MGTVPAHIPDTAPEDSPRDAGCRGASLVLKAPSRIRYGISHGERGKIAHVTTAPWVVSGRKCTFRETFRLEIASLSGRRSGCIRRQMISEA
jgi:hypothetical protein